MTTRNNHTVKTNVSSEPYHFKKRLGSTTFHVNAYFNTNAKETAKDKIERLILNDIALQKHYEPTLEKVANL